MTLVKICGITNTRDAAAATEFGADFLGLNFYAKSPRFVTEQAAKEILSVVPETVGTIGVFVNESCDRIVDIVDTLSLAAVQLHGDECGEFVARLRELSNVKVIKAIRVSPELDTEAVVNFPADALLLDAYSPRAYGGTGERFDWGLAGTVSNMVDQVYLAGGLTAENVAEAVNVVRPYAVDVASGVESSPGRKDHEKLKAFIKNAQYV